MSRALIAIGVDQYDHVSALNAAEGDAAAVYEALTDAAIGGYTPSLSRLLLSPTLADVRGAVEEILLGGAPIDEFTFFFAGHGMIQPVGFYMAMRDTRLDRATATAFSLSELFAQVAEGAPAQTNVILDACFSGGLAADLSLLTRPETSGYVGSPAVTLLAMSARDQTAGEFPQGGIGTTALLDCLSGRALVREDVGVLELLDIAPIVIERVKRSDGQNPVLTALNVHRRSQFCLNPLFQASSQSALAKWEPRAFLEAVEPVLASHANDPQDLISDVERLFDHMIAKADGSRDAFKGAELRATAAIALLPYAGIHPQVRACLEARLADLLDSLHRAMTRAVESLTEDRFAMLAGPALMSGLYLLPIRLSKLIGWSGAAYHIGRLLGQDAAFPRETYRCLLDLLVEHYRLALAAMSDSQAPCLAVGLTAAAALDLEEQGEAILSSVFHSFVECAARVADASLPPDRILPYLLARRSGEYQRVERHLARPSELGVVLLLLSPLFGLADIFDDAFETLDHVTVNAFVTDDYSNFGHETIHDGENNPFMIGHEVWRVNDLLGTFPSHAYAWPTEPAISGAAILAALVFPDRVPWFVFPQPATRTSEAADGA